MALVMGGTHHQAVIKFSEYEGAPTKDGVSPHSVARESRVAVHVDTTTRKYEPSSGLHISLLRQYGTAMVSCLIFFHVVVK